MAGEQGTSRRELFKRLFGGLRPEEERPAGETQSGWTPPPRGYDIVDRRDLADGGIGLFVVVPKALTRDGLENLGDEFHARFQVLSSVVIEVFDDVEAAKTVRSGSRVVGEQRFAAALARQRASYFRNQRSGVEYFDIRQPPPQIIHY